MYHQKKNPVLFSSEGDVESDGADIEDEDRTEDD